MSKKCLSVVIVALGLCLFVSTKALTSSEPPTHGWWDFQPESYTLINHPYLLLRVHLDEATRWSEDKVLNRMIVGDGNVLDDPHGYPQGYGVIAYRGESGRLAFLVEKEGAWEVSENFKPKPKEPFYLCLWQSGKNRNGN